MPIRTNRGRAAVYRKLWGWPLRSPLHLVATVLAVALVAAVSVLVSQYARDTGPGQSGHDASAGSGDAAVLSTSASATTNRVRPPTALPKRGPGPTATPTSADPDPDALHVAAQWGKAWVHHPEGTTSKQWLAGMKPYTTPEFLPVMSSVDPANIPASTVTGEPEPQHSYTSSLEVLLPTDGPKLDITLIKTGSGWRVARYTKAS